MKSKLSIISLLAPAVVALVAGFGSAPALAQGISTPRIDQAQQEIGDRIRQGMSTGQITPSEAQALYRRERDIQAREAQYKARGNVLPLEREELRSDLNGLAMEVERMIANRDVVGQPGSGVSTPGIDNRKANISQRVDDGYRTGRITEREARRLKQRGREIERMEASFKSDGVMTQQERRALREELADMQDQVDRLMRNDRMSRGYDAQSYPSR